MDIKTVRSLDDVKGLPSDAPIRVESKVIKEGVEYVVACSGFLSGLSDSGLRVIHPKVEPEGMCSKFTNMHYEAKDGVITGFPDVELLVSNDKNKKYSQLFEEHFRGNQ